MSSVAWLYLIGNSGCVGHAISRPVSVEIILRRSGNQATGTSTAHSGDVTFTITVTMRCIDRSG
jgi:hypothetical protein